MTTLAPTRVLGRTYPRIATPPLVQGPPGPCGCGCALTEATTDGFRVVDFAEMIGRPLDPWQRHLVIHALELYPDGRPRFRQVLVLVARQNGKTELLVILAEFWQHVEEVPMVLGTSTNLEYAKESWNKAVRLAKKSPKLRHRIASVRYANGEQELETVSESRYKIAASTRTGGRSLTVNKLIMDELREHKTWDAYSASEPTTTAVADAQIWMITNQGDDKSVVLNALREQAIEGSDERLGIFEWSSPDGMAASDVEALAMANPNLGRRIDIDALIGKAKRAEAAGGEQLAQFLTEVHCRRVPLLDPAIDMAAWQDCKGDATLDNFRDRVALCMDVSIDERHATLAAAAVDGQKVRVELVEAWEGWGAVSDMMQALPRLVTEVQPSVIGWFPSGPAASVATALAERPDWPPPGVEIADIRGGVTAVCMGFAEQVRALSIVHGGDPLLDSHCQAAEKLNQGDGWRFVRRGSTPVDAVYAAAGAVHLARLLPEPLEGFFVNG